MYLVDHPFMYIQEHVDLLWRTCRPTQDWCLLTMAILPVITVNMLKNDCFYSKSTGPNSDAPTMPKGFGRIRQGRFLLAGGGGGVLEIWSTWFGGYSHSRSLTQVC